MAEVGDLELDLRGEVCPYTILKSRTAVEEMRDRDAVLCILVDDSESAAHLPESLDLEGHHVLAIDRVAAGCWRILVSPG